MIQSILKISGKMLVNGYFRGMYTEKIAEKDGEKLFVVPLSSLEIDTLQKNAYKIGALIANEEDMTRHISIFARELGIPMIFSDEKTAPHELEELELGDFRFFIENGVLPSSSSTADGVKIRLLASVSDKKGILRALENNLDIGLLRTEFLTENPRELYALCANSKFSACRLFDFEGDKQKLSENFAFEHCKTIQIVDIMETSNFKCGILLPNVEKALQVKEYKMYINQYNAKKAPPLGAMLETKAAFKHSLNIMRATDFCAVGINSLLRMGATNAQIGTLCARLTAEAKQLFLPLYACGEPNEALLKVLIKSGITGFSLSLASLEDTAKAIRNICYF